MPISNGTKATLGDSAKQNPSREACASSGGDRFHRFLICFEGRERPPKADDGSSHEQAQQDSNHHPENQATDREVTLEAHPGGHWSIGKRPSDGFGRPVDQNASDPEGKWCRCDREQLCSRGDQTRQEDVGVEHEKQEDHEDRGNEPRSGNREKPEQRAKKARQHDLGGGRDPDQGLEKASDREHQQVLRACKVHAAVVTRGAVLSPWSREFSFRKYHLLPVRRNPR